MESRLSLSELPRSENLVDIWTARYLSNNNNIYSLISPSTETVSPSSSVLNETASAQGRRSTCGRFSDYLTTQLCKRAALRTKDLYTHHADIDLMGVADLVRFAIEIYPVLLNFYQTHTPTVVVYQSGQQKIPDQQTKVFAIPEITTLARVLDPFLLVFQSRHTIDIDWQTRSFLSTQLSLSSGLFLETLSAAEKMLLAPYFYFLEEYVTIPWAQFFAAAATHDPTSPTLKVVEKILPKMLEISLAVYTRWSNIFGGYYSRRGQFDKPGVRHSTLRDFSMFQVYLWVGVLQGNLELIEQDLVALSVLVYKGIGIPWEMTVKGTKLLAEEIVNALDPAEQAIVVPYTDSMVRIFSAQ